MRVERIPMTPVPMEVGDKVKFPECKRPFTVRTRSERYVILTQPFNIRHTVLYTVIDWEGGVRGPDDYYGLGYETDEQIARALALFERKPIDPDEDFIKPEVSYRHGIRCRIESVNGVPVGEAVAQ